MEPTEAVLGYLEGGTTGRRGPERGGPPAPAPPDVPEASGPAGVAPLGRVHAWSPTHTS